MFFGFFFKQKTAYEVRISDLSSDVCSSDLLAHTKEAACGCAGIFNAPTAMQAYAQVFHEEGALDRLESFASLNGPRFYGLPLNEGKIRLALAAAEAPQDVEIAGDRVVEIGRAHV